EPAKARAPPHTHTASSACGFGTIVATNAGVVKMPTPTTFAMTMAAASTGPSRRSSEALATSLPRGDRVSLRRPFCVPTDDGPRIRQSVLPQLERRTGACLFGWSTAVGDDRLLESSQLFDVRTQIRQ